MPEFSRRRRIRNTVVVMLFGFAAFFAVDRFWLGRLTPERAQAALVEKFPELADTSMTERHQGALRYSLGNCGYGISESEWLSAGVWARFNAESGLMSVAGRFEWRGFGRWRAMNGGVEFIPLAEPTLS